MNVSNVIKRNYKKFIPLAGYKNKPKQTQSCQACVVCEGVAGLNKPNLLRRRRITLIVFEVLLIVLAVLLPFIIELKFNVATPVVICITLAVIALLIIGLLAYLSSRTEQQKRD